MAKIDKDSIASGHLSEPQTADGMTYRVVQPGQAVVFAIDPWWGDGVAAGRAGTMYMARVRVQGHPEAARHLPVLRRAGHRAKAPARCTGSAG